MKVEQDLSAMESSPSGGYRPLEWDEETVTRFWKWQSQFPEEYFTNLFGHRIVARLAPHLAGAKTILDYGCGLGFLPKHLATLGASVTATDFSPEAIAITQDRNQGLARFEGACTIDALTESNRLFDRIVAVEVIEHLNDAHLESFLTNLKRFLAVDAKVIITTPHDENLRASEIYCPCCDHTFHRYQHIRRFTKASLAATLERFGFEPLEIYATDFRLRPWWHPKRWVLQLLRKGANAQPHLVAVARLKQG